MWRTESIVVTTGCTNHRWTGKVKRTYSFRHSFLTILHQSAKFYDGPKLLLNTWNVHIRIVRHKRPFSPRCPFFCSCSSNSQTSAVENPIFVTTWCLLKLVIWNRSMSALCDFQWTPNLDIRNIKSHIQSPCQYTYLDDLPYASTWFHGIWAAPKPILNWEGKATS